MARWRGSSSSMEASSAGGRRGASSGTASRPTRRSSWCSSGPASRRRPVPRCPAVSQAPVDAAQRVDFDEHAVWVAERLDDGDHLVGHSYGGVIALLAAAEAGNRLASLDGDRAALHPCRARRPGCRGLRARRRRALREGRAARAGGLPAHVPRRGRLGLRPTLSAAARARAGRQGAGRGSAGRGRPTSRWSGSLPLACRHSSSRVRIIPRSTRSATSSSSALGAERLVLPGFGHNAQLHPGFNAALLDFVARAQRKETGDGQETRAGPRRLDAQARIMTGADPTCAGVTGACASVRPTADPRK